MTVASEITRIEGNISAAYTAADAKGATMPATENSANLATCIASISGGGGTGARDVPLARVSDDNGNEIGTWYMNFTDANGNEYKVVLLDTQYRNTPTIWCSDVSIGVTNMPYYTNLKTSNVWEAKETATTNTQLILDFCTANNYTSSSCSHCRSQSFTISGTTYYGQLPNTIEVFYLAKHYNEFDSIDTSASSDSGKNFSSARSIWTSCQNISYDAWRLNPIGYISAGGAKNSDAYTCPVLEIPLS